MLKLKESVEGLTQLVGTRSWRRTSLGDDGDDGDLSAEDHLHKDLTKGHQHSSTAFAPQGAGAATAAMRRGERQPGGRHSRRPSCVIPEADNAYIPEADSASQSFNSSVCTSPNSSIHGGRLFESTGEGADVMGADVMGADIIGAHGHSMSSHACWADSTTRAHGSWKDPSNCAGSGRDLGDLGADGGSHGADGGPRFLQVLTSQAEDPSSSFPRPSRVIGGVAGGAAGGEPATSIVAPASAPLQRAFPQSVLKRYGERPSSSDRWRQVRDHVRFVGISSPVRARSPATLHAPAAANPAVAAPCPNVSGRPSPARLCPPAPSHLSQQRDGRPDVLPPPAVLPAPRPTSAYSPSSCSIIPRASPEAPPHPRQPPAARPQERRAKTQQPPHQPTNLQPPPHAPKLGLPLPASTAHKGQTDERGSAPENMEVAPLRTAVRTSSAPTGKVAAVISAESQDGRLIIRL